MAKKLYVGNLSYDTTDSGLETLFATVGEVAEAVVITDRYSGRSRGFGFVQMADDAGTQAAIEQLDGRELDGRALKVAEAQPRRDSDDRGGGGSGGGGGGDRGGGGGRW